MTDQHIIDAIKEGLLDGNDLDATDQSRAEAVLRALRANGLVVGKVKPLEWVKHPKADIWRCDTAIGAFKVFSGFGLGRASWDFDSATDFRDATSQSAADVDAAKAAAQADYEARIRDAIE